VIFELSELNAGFASLAQGWLMLYIVVPEGERVETHQSSGSSSKTLSTHLLDYLFQSFGFKLSMGPNNLRGITSSHTDISLFLLVWLRKRTSESVNFEKLITANLSSFLMDQAVTATLKMN